MKIAATPLMVLPLLALAGACAGTTPSPAEPMPLAPAGADGPCVADAAADLVGQPASQALAADALRRTNARSVRWITPGSAVTMDYRADRLNVHLDNENRVTEFKCG